MLKKRLIFTLLADSGRFMLSRNFSLQAAGDLAWIRKHFDAIAFSIDELIVLNVSRGARDLAGFARLLKETIRHCFMPIASGGGIRRPEDALLLLRSGADKIVINTPLYDDPALVRTLVRRFGSQCVVASIDYKVRDEISEVYTDNGARRLELTLEQAVTRAQELGAGELYLTSITQDGTGRGLDEDRIGRLADRSSVPVIISGGAGRFDHLSRALGRPEISAVSTANLFAFMADGLTEARRKIIEGGTPLATWGITPQQARATPVPGRPGSAPG